MIPFENAPSTQFQRRVAISAAGGQFSDGYSLGIIAIALDLAKQPLGLTSWWFGAIGAASLFGLFLGSLVSGSLSDRFGRRPVFTWGMLIFTLIAALQYFSSSAYELFVWRFLLGVALGADYVSCKAMVTEYASASRRGPLLSIMGIAWAAGYLCSFLAGYFIQAGAGDAWRMALLSSALPALATFALRYGIPESPQWLARRGRGDEAQAIVVKCIGQNVGLPVAVSPHSAKLVGYGNLFKQPLLKNLVVGCFFHTSQVVPFFALGTFLPIILSHLGVKDIYFGSIIYNVLMMIGAVAGWYVIDRLPRRTFLVQGFLLTAALLGFLIVWRTAPSYVTVLVFAVLGFVMAGAGILQFVYPPELFPTELRARGVGFEIACSRIGSAISTFLLPVVVDLYGIYASLGACMALSVLAAIICQIWAPETLRRNLV
ncbi:MFS transporter [Acetobacter sp. DsW_063]|uniref:MFS transporter n=1 Tax=Acetobacter sp. DsW_063 TaxID=1514894 RepID=UPI000A3BA938|nr:MFS transporter [Acetobacter sp. DsW_063]